MAEVKNIPVSHLRLNKKLQVRPLDEDHLESLVNGNTGGPWPALKVRPGSNGTYEVFCGGHRLQAAQEMDASFLSCEVYEGISDEQAIITAYRDNLAHGLPLSNAERGNYARLLHKLHPEFSLKDIARQVHLSPTSVHRYLSGKTYAEMKDKKSSQISGEKFLETCLAFVNGYETYDEQVEAVKDAVRGANDARVVLEELSEVFQGASDDL